MAGPYQGSLLKSPEFKAWSWLDIEFYVPGRQLEATV